MRPKPSASQACGFDVNPASNRHACTADESAANRTRKKDSFESRCLTIFVCNLEKYGIRSTSDRRGWGCSPNVEWGRSTMAGGAVRDAGDCRLRAGMDLAGSTALHVFRKIEIAESPADSNCRHGAFCSSPSETACNCCLGGARRAGPAWPRHCSARVGDSPHRGHRSGGAARQRDQRRPKHSSSAVGAAARACQFRCRPRQR